jgi:hypothetical protein
MGTAARTPVNAPKPSPPLCHTQLRMTGGLDVRTRVTRRSQQEKEQEHRIETSEYMEQVGARANSIEAFKH